MWRLIDLANSVTLTTLLSGLFATIFAMEGQFALALVALIVAGICDLFDGLIARRIKRSDLNQRIGQRLDSLADVCSFGLAPAVILYSFGLNRPHEVCALALLLIATALRVAYYDVVGLSESDGATKYYSGLPCTYVALVLPLAFLAGSLLGLAQATFLVGCVALLSIAMTMRIRIVKPRGIAYLGFAILAASVCTLLTMYPALVET